MKYASARRGRAKERKKIFRVVDVNVNRCKEGLRVVEDTFRFILKDDRLRKRIRRIRHCLDKIVDAASFKLEIVEARDSMGDSGKRPHRAEMGRAGTFDILYANFQRSKESLRVLEEFFKILDTRKVPLIKQLRYSVYEAEKNAFKRWGAIRSS